MRRIIVMLPAVIACSSAGRSATPAPPTPPQVLEVPGAAPLRVEKERLASGGSVAAPIAQVWNVIGAVYRDLGIEPTTVLTDAYTIGNQSMKLRRSLAGTPLSRYLDCGSGTGIGPNADYYNVELSIMTQLTAKASGGTDIRSVVDATAKPVSLGSNPVVCTSTSLLESRVAKMVAERMTGGTN
jgi:hypothetical protein